MNQLRIYRTFLLIAFVIPHLCVAQNNRRDSINIKSLIDSINKSLNDNYVFPEKAKNISLYLQAQSKSNVYAAFKNNPDKLAEKIQADINTIHKDPHMHIQYDLGFVQQDERKPSEEEIRQDKFFWRENNYSFKKLEILPGNIGYFPLEGFMDDIESAKPTIYSAMKFLSNTSTMIIDLRENRGGSPEMVSQIESYFFKVKTHMNDIISRTTKDTTVFYADPAKADSLNLSMPVYILTSHSTFSAAEDFSYAMQMEKRATIVGEITGGGAHPQMPFSVGQGFVISVPFARSLNPITKTDWEGTGVIPDFKVEASKAFLKAQELIFKEKLLNAKDEKEKHKYEFYLRSIVLNNEVKAIPLRILPMFSGTYHDVTIYVEKNKIFSKNNHNGNLSELKHLYNNLFLIDENVQIEFFKDTKGLYSSIKIYLNDGSVFEDSKK